MIIFPLKIPLIVKQLEALIPRLHPNHPKLPEIEYDLAKRRRGYRGERALLYFLSIIDDKDVYIFHNLRTKVKDCHFEIDTLVLTKEFFLIFQVKNYKAEELIFDSNFNQIFRRLNGEIQILDDPLLQAKRHKSLLIMWLKKHKIASYIPIEEFVVIANPKCKITASPDHPTAHQKVIRPQGILSIFENSILKFQKIQITSADLKKLAKSLHKQNKHEVTNVLENYHISRKEIANGIRCPDCGALPMLRMKGIWVCQKCRHLSKDVHLKTLEEYVYLYGTEITNKQLREFLQLSSNFLATEILQANCLKKTGKGSQTVYILPPPIDYL